MAIYMKKGEMANVMLDILDDFLRYDFWCTGIQSFTDDFEFWIAVNEY